MAFATAQVTVTTTAGALTAAETDSRAGQSVTVYGTADFYVGDATVTSDTGFLVPANTSFSTDMEPGEVLYARTASSTSTVYVFREGV